MGDPENKAKLICSLSVLYVYVLLVDLFVSFLIDIRTEGMANTFFLFVIIFLSHIPWYLILTTFVQLAHGFKNSVAYFHNWFN